METHRCVEFTGVELVGGTKLAALVEKVATSLVEKSAAGCSSGEDGRRCGGEPSEEDDWTRGFWRGRVDERLGH
jgi:hypothetical protein